MQFAKESKTDQSGQHEEEDGQFEMVLRRFALFQPVPIVRHILGDENEVGAAGKLPNILFN